MSGMCPNPEVLSGHLSYCPDTNNGFFEMAQVSSGTLLSLAVVYSSFSTKLQVL
jgi:hypothetical protein